MLSPADITVAILSAPTSEEACDGLWRRIERHAREIQILAVVEKGDLAATVDAVRRGATDLISRDMSDAALRERLLQASARADEARESAERLRRLRDMCHRLTEAVRRSEQQIDRLSRDVTKLAEDAGEQISEAALAGEFRALLSQELDLESMLRTALEYLLSKTGPTNAAVFLPDADRHYSLGAYVNYDCPRDSANLLLEHLAAAICPPIERETELLRFEDGDEFAEHLGEQASLIRDRDIIAFRCAHNGRTFAIMVLFRDRTDPFTDSLPGTLDTLRSIFAAQLESILRVHHRSRPQWPREAAEDVGETDDDFGFGVSA